MKRIGLWLLGVVLCVGVMFIGLWTVLFRWPVQRAEWFPGKIYVVAKIAVHEWSTEVFLEGFDKPFNSVSFNDVDENAVDETIEITEPELPKRLEAMIVDTDNAFLVRIVTDPRTTDTGIANIIPTGVSREEKDYAIAIGKNLVKCWNEK